MSGVLRVYEVETRRPDGTVLLRFVVPSFVGRFGWSDLFGYDGPIVGTAEAWIRESPGDAWRLIARQDANGRYAFSPGDGMPTVEFEIGPSYE